MNRLKKYLIPAGATLAVLATGATPTPASAKPIKCNPLIQVCADKTSTVSDRRSSWSAKRVGPALQTADAQKANPYRR